VIIATPEIQGSENPGFFKKAQPTVFLGFVGFFGFFYWNEQFGSLLVDLAHQLSFYLVLPVLQII